MDKAQTNLLHKGSNVVQEEVEPQPRTTALQYNLFGSAGRSLPGNAKNLSQNELTKLNKQRYLKLKLRNNLMNIDSHNTEIIGIDKFDIECKELGINLSSTDLNTILNLYEDRARYNHQYQMPSINYTHALGALVPVLQKNSDKAAYIDKNQVFKIGWTLSKNTKLRDNMAKKH